MSIAADKYLNKIVLARTAEGGINFLGWCVGYCDAPTVSVWCSDGTQVHWRADLVEIIEMPEEAVKIIADKFKPLETGGKAARGRDDSEQRSDRTVTYRTFESSE